MKVSCLFKKPGNAVNRVYKGVRNAKRFSYAMSAADIALAALGARRKDVVNTALFGVLGCIFLKHGKDFSQMQEFLKPYYQEIVERAKLIKAVKKHSVK